MQVNLELLQDQSSRSDELGVLGRSKDEGQFEVGMLRLRRDFCEVSSLLQHDGKKKPTH